MRYFLLGFLAIAVLTMGVLGFRGQKFVRRPFRVFPDMDEQDYVQAQESSRFFRDGMGARRPVQGTVPRRIGNRIFRLEFSEGRSGHYFTGAIDDYFANGLPVELGLEAGGIAPFMRRGADRYAIFCAICHGESGNGLGVVSRYMDVQIANLREPRFGRDQYPDGAIFNVITHGRGLMGAYGASIPVRDRWAIVAYVRALQGAGSSAGSSSPPETAASGGN